MAAPLGGLLRDLDGEGYFAALFAPADRREALMALHAFDAELARVRDSVREAALGEIRLQWWRDVVEGSRGEEAAGNPIATALLAAIDRYRLPRTALAAVVEARRADLYGDAPESLNDLEGRFGETHGALLQLGVLVLAPEAARSLADASGHGGCGLGVAGLLRRFARARAQGRCDVPADLLRDRTLQRAQVLADEDAAARAVSALSDFGLDHCRRFLSAVADAPSAARPALLAVAPAALVLGRARREPRDVVAARHLSTPLRARWAMFRAASGKWPRLD